MPALPTALSLCGLVGRLPVAVVARGAGGASAASAAPTGEMIRDARGLFEAARAAGFRGVVLDAALAGVRPRELDRSARRDVASVLSRLGLAFAGVDLFVPTTHLIDAAHVDRAAAALAQALEFAGELATMSGAAPAARVLTTTLPEGLGEDVLRHLLDVAGRAGVTLADTAWPPRGRRVATGVTALGTGAIGASVRPDARGNGAVTGAAPPPSAPAPASASAEGLGVALDPAEVIIAKHDPAEAVLRLPTPPASARLSDLAGVGRVAPGSRAGRLDRLAYEVALVTRGYAGMLVADVRNVPDAAEALGAYV